MKNKIFIATLFALSTGSVFATATAAEQAAEQVAAQAASEKAMTDCLKTKTQQQCTAAQNAAKKVGAAAKSGS